MIPCAQSSSQQTDFFCRESEPQIFDEVFSLCLEELHKRVVKTTTIGAKQIVSREEMRQLSNINSWQGKISKIENKLRNTGSTIDEWHPGTQIWKTYEIRNKRKQLLTNQHKLVYEFTERQSEAEHLHRSSRGNQRRVEYLKSICKRRKTTRNCIKAYNDALSNLRRSDPVSAAGIRPLTADLLAELGVEYDALWDIGRLDVGEDWAKFVHVRQAIEAMCRLERCREERVILTEEAERMTEWLCARNYIARRSIDKDGPVSRNVYVSKLLLHYHKVARNMLRVKAGSSLSSQNRERLEALVNGFEEWRQDVVEAIKRGEEDRGKYTTVKMQEPSEDGYDSDIEDMLKDMIIGDDPGVIPCDEEEVNEDEMAMEGEMLERQMNSDAEDSGSEEEEDDGE